MLHRHSCLDSLTVPRKTALPKRRFSNEPVYTEGSYKLLPVFPPSPAWSGRPRCWVQNNSKQRVHNLYRHSCQQSSKTSMVEIRWSSPSVERALRYSSHSVGSRYFFRLLHCLHAGTTFPRVDLPPLTRGTIWSIVSCPGDKVFPQ